MDNIQLAATAAVLAPGSETVQGKQFVEITVVPELLVPTATALKQNHETRFDMLVCVTGVGQRAWNGLSSQVDCI
jgi:hypothetical protein